MPAAKYPSSSREESASVSPARQVGPPPAAPARPEQSAVRNGVSQNLVRDVKARGQSLKKGRLRAYWSTRVRLSTPRRLVQPEFPRCASHREASPAANM